MTATVPEAIQQAGWFTRYALDRLSMPDRKLDPSVRTHLVAARAHLAEAAEFVKPEHDQVVTDNQKEAA